MTAPARARRGRRAVAVAALTAAALALVPPAGALPNDPLAERQWGLRTIGAETAWAAGRGAGTVIAIVDTGVHLDHPDLRDKLVAGIDFVDDDDRPQDENGHGTHVAGIAAASTGNGIGVAGAAPDARIMPVRVLGADGGGSGADVDAGIRWAADRGATVINLSLGSDTQAVLGPGFSEAVRYAWDKGSIPVVAAGNQFITGSGFADEPALVVTATSRQDTKAYFSSTSGSARWPLSAPGGAASLTSPVEEDILSTYHDPDRPEEEYAYLAGTSMAAPHVAGAAAVLRGLGLTPQQTVDRLLATAKDLGPEGRDSTFGVGRLDLAAATGAAAAPPAPPPPPPAGEPSPGAPPVEDPPPSDGAEPPREDPPPTTAAGGAAAGDAGAPPAPPEVAAPPPLLEDGAVAPLGEATTTTTARVPGEAVAITADGDRVTGETSSTGAVGLLAGALAAAAGAGTLLVRRRAWA